MLIRGTFSEVCYYPNLDKSLASFPAPAERHEENCTLVLRVRRKEVRYIVVEEGETGCAEVQCICSEIHLAAEDSGFELNGSVSAIAEAFKNGMEIRKEEDIGCGVAREILSKAKVAGLATEVAFL